MRRKPEPERAPPSCRWFRENSTSGAERWKTEAELELTPRLSAVTPPSPSATQQARRPTSPVCTGQGPAPRGISALLAPKRGAGRGGPDTRKDRKRHIHSLAWRRPSGSRATSAKPYDRSRKKLDGGQAGETQESSNWSGMQRRQACHSHLRLSDRHTWQDEKERVLKYQAQLQLSYVETLQRNQALEERVGQLGAKQGTTPGSPGSPVSLSIPVPVTLTLSPPTDDPKHQLAPPWPGPSRLERIESTEI
ncbi:hypothetical protein cypCar_00046731 [Cyprinus carpio]|nr:hypothetical protein cypCar_00046731 [Cyprinus carpio]